MEERLAALETAMAETRAENARLQAELQRREAGVARQADEQARARTLPMVGGAVDTRLLSKPEAFTGKDTDWPQFALLTRAYVGAISPRMFELLRRAENPEESLDRVDLDPGDELLDSQLYYVLTMLIKGSALDKVTLVEYGEGLHLWRLLVQEYEPQWRSRNMALHQAIRNYQLSDDVILSLDGFERLLRQYQTATKKEIDDETKFSIILSSLSRNSSNQKHADLAEHLILNSHRLETYSEMKREIREILGTKKYLHKDVEVNAVGKGKGKSSKGKVGKGKAVEGKVTVRFTGECFVCGKKGHKQSECWQRPSAGKPSGKAGQGTGTGQSSTPTSSFQGTCDYCGVRGHKKSECRKMKADQAAKAGEQSRKRPRTDISQLEAQLQDLTLQVRALNHDARPGDVSGLSISSLGCSGRSDSEGRVSLGLDSGAEVTVWPPDLYPQVITQENASSRKGIKYFGPGDTKHPTLPDLGSRRYELDIGGVKRFANVHVAPVRKPLLALCDLEDHGHDIFFVGGKRWAKHRVSGEVIPIQRRGGKYEIDATVVLPSPGNGEGRVYQ